MGLPPGRNIRISALSWQPRTPLMQGTDTRDFGDTNVSQRWGHGARLNFCSTDPGARELRAQPSGLGVTCRTMRCYRVRRARCPQKMACPSTPIDAPGPLGLFLRTEPASRMQGRLALQHSTAQQSTDMFSVRVIAETRFVHS